MADRTEQAETLPLFPMKHTAPLEEAAEAALLQSLQREAGIAGVDGETAEETVRTGEETEEIFTAEGAFRAGEETEDVLQETGGVTVEMLNGGAGEAGEETP